MSNRIRHWWCAHPYLRWLYPICLVLTAIAFVVAVITGKGYIWGYGGLVVLFLLACRPGSALYACTMEKSSIPKTLCSVLVAIATMAACILPMNQLPLWNGEDPGHRNQYEMMPEAILDGHVYLDYGDDEALSQLENPYDPAARDEAGVTYHWDHAYYNGHYYMYFGVVPVFLAFLPYRILTGTPLTTYHATQLFVALAIAGIFVLFHFLAKRFFKSLPYSVYLGLTVAFSAMSVWYSTAEPALYCTAITSALALEIWSLYFFIKAVWGEQRENRQILLAGIGALLGALAFGCRPSIALANILVIPLLVVFLKQRQFTFKLLGKLALAALPYALVAAALMLYNYVRFDDPFEFGQAYQLTVADQSQYSITLNATTLLRICNDSIENFFGVGDLQATFPYLKASSVFFNFPILLLCAAMGRSSVLRSLRRHKLLPLLITLFLTVVIITAVDIMWTPYLLERYRMDVYFLMGIACFIIIGLWHTACDGRHRAYLHTGVIVLSAVTIVSACLFCLETIGHYYPDKIGAIGNALHVIG